MAWTKVNRPAQAIASAVAASGGGSPPAALVDQAGRILALSVAVVKPWTEVPATVRQAP